MLGLLALAALLLAGYGLHTSRNAHPLLRLALFRVRTFRAAAAGSFFTRRDGGIPSVSASLPGWVRIHRHPVRAAHDAARARRHEPQADHAAPSIYAFGYRQVADFPTR